MEKTPYGPFPFIPITQRPKLTWPDGARVALWVIVNIEIFPLDSPLPGDQDSQIKSSATRQENILQRTKTIQSTEFPLWLVSVPAPGRYGPR